MNFSQRLTNAIRTKESCLMLGLDPNHQKLPEPFQEQVEEKLNSGTSFAEAWASAYETFCLQMMETCSPYICGVKPQSAYFEVWGSAGIKALENAMQRARELDLLTLMDVKRGDIGSTCEAYAKAYLDDESPLVSDSCTVSPFLGSDGISPFLDYCQNDDKGIFILCKTSNPSAMEFQDTIQDNLTAQIDSYRDYGSTNSWSSVGAVVGATNPVELQTYRDKMPHTWFLCPGVGAQGGRVSDVMQASRDGLGVIIPISRAVLYASDGTDYLAAAEKTIKGFWEEQK